MSRSRWPAIFDASIALPPTSCRHVMLAYATHWSIRAMAAAQQVSAATVQRIWNKHKLQPHRVESFKFSSDPQFAPKVRDIVGLYMNPPDKAIVLSVDEKSQIQALAGRSRFCRYVPASPRGKHRITNATEQRHYSRR